MSNLKPLARVSACLMLIFAFVFEPAQAGVNLKAVNTIVSSPIPGSHDEHLRRMFNAGLVSTQDLSFDTPDGTIYLQTGDIAAEWLRDSSAQVRPYLYLAKDDPQIRSYLKQVVARQAAYLKLDSYANAFTPDYRVKEEKYELDSLLYPILLAWTYWKVTGDATIFTPQLKSGFDSALSTMLREQQHDLKSHYTHNELARAGHGNAVAFTGMIWTGFRPSDDACKFNYLIPSEMMAVSALGALTEIENSIYRDQAVAASATQLRKDVFAGIQKYGVVHTKVYGDIYAYEVDGLSQTNSETDTTHVLLADDANVPSLLSAPYLGFTPAVDPIYQNTRRFILSNQDPYMYSGRLGSGVGSPHTPSGFVWPLSLIMEALTAQTDLERDACVRELLASDPGDNRLHESFDPNDASRFTRANFGWPNALFAEYILLHYYGKTPLPVPSDLDLRQPQKP